jgi:hypothetical protein
MGTGDIEWLTLSHSSFSLPHSRTRTASPPLLFADFFIVAFVFVYFGELFNSIPFMSNVNVRPTPQFVNTSCSEDIRIFVNRTTTKSLRVTYGKLFTYYDQFQSCADNFNTSAHTMNNTMSTGSVNNRTNWLLASLSRGAAESMEHACDQCGRLFRRYIPKLVYNSRMIKPHRVLATDSSKTCIFIFSSSSSSSSSSSPSFSSYRIRFQSAVQDFVVVSQFVQIIVNTLLPFIIRRFLCKPIETLGGKISQKITRPRRAMRHHHIVSTRLATGGEGGTAWCDNVLTTDRKSKGKSEGKSKGTSTGESKGESKGGSDSSVLVKTAGTDAANDDILVNQEEADGEEEGEDDAGVDWRQGLDLRRGSTAAVVKKLRESNHNNSFYQHPSGPLAHAEDDDDAGWRGGGERCSSGATGRTGTLKETSKPKGWDGEGQESKAGGGGAESRDRSNNKKREGGVGRGGGGRGERQNVSLLNEARDPMADDSNLDMLAVTLVEEEEEDEIFDELCDDKDEAQRGAKTKKAKVKQVSIYTPNGKNGEEEEQEEEDLTLEPASRYINPSSPASSETSSKRSQRSKWGLVRTMHQIGKHDTGVHLESIMEELWRFDYTPFDDYAEVRCGGGVCVCMCVCVCVCV